MSDAEVARLRALVTGNDAREARETKRLHDKWTEASTRLTQALYERDQARRALARLLAPQPDTLPETVTEPSRIMERLAGVLGLDLSDDGPIDGDAWLDGVRYLDRCVDAARQEGAEEAATRRADEREYARSRGVR